MGESDDDISLADFAHQPDPIPETCQDLVTFDLFGETAPNGGVSEVVMFRTTSRPVG